jgi:hypothetical protein
MQNANGRMQESAQRVQKLFHLAFCVLHFALAPWLVGESGMQDAEGDVR